MSSDVLIRFGIFILVLFVMMLLEFFFPKRELKLAKVKRWQTNLFLAVINIVVLKVLGPLTALSVALYVNTNQWGALIYIGSALPFFVQVVIGVVLLDFAIYLQHLASHKFPFLWRFHKVHHADRDIDASTGIRFHPVEALLSMLYKCCVVFVFGPLVISVIIFEVLLNASAMFNHANLRIPARLDTLLRLIIVTPDFHRVHHSTIESETNSNYGFFLSWWDKLMRTYIGTPSRGHQQMEIGLDEYQNQSPAILWWCVGLPFKRENKQDDR